MKIFQTFDSRIDSEEFLEAVNTYWKWNVILIKAHWIKLLPPLFFTLLSLWLLALMLYIIYVNLFEGNKMIFWWLTTFYLITTLSWSWYAVCWIIDRIYKQVNSKVKYITNVEDVVSRKKWFELFLKSSTWIFFIHLFFIIFNASVPFIVEDFTRRWSLAVPIVILLVDFLFFFCVTLIIYWVIDYEMNFWICSENSFKLFKQVWIFSSDVTDISPSSINIIKYNAKWFLEAIFCFWTVSLYTDAEVADRAKNTIEFHYIPDPKNTCKRLNQILGKS